MSSKLSQNAITALTAAALALPGVALAESTTKAKDTKPVVEKVEIKDEIVAEAKADDTADVTSNEGGEQESSDTSQGEADSQKSAGIDRVKSITFDAKYSHYREKDRAPSDAGPVSLERYKIDVWQASVTAPIDNFEVSLGLQRDVQSGSSSAALVPAKVFALGPSHILLDSRTGSSIVDERNSASVGGSYFREDSKYSLGGYYSIEHDHRSMAVSASGQWDFNKNNTSLVASFSFAGDVIRPHQSGVTGFAQYESGKRQPLNTI